VYGRYSINSILQVFTRSTLKSYNLVLVEYCPIKIWAAYIWNLKLTSLDWYHLHRVVYIKKICKVKQQFKKCWKLVQNNHKYESLGIKQMSSGSFSPDWTATQKFIDEYRTASLWIFFQHENPLTIHNCTGALYFCFSWPHWPARVTNLLKLRKTMLPVLLSLLLLLLLLLSLWFIRWWSYFSCWTRRSAQVGAVIGSQRMSRWAVQVWVIKMCMVGVLVNIHVRHFMAGVGPQGAVPRLSGPGAKLGPWASP